VPFFFLCPDQSFDFFFCNKFSNSSEVSGLKKNAKKIKIKEKEQ